MNREVGAFISKCIWDEKVQELKVFFHSDTEGAAIAQPSHFERMAGMEKPANFSKISQLLRKKGSWTWIGWLG